MTINVDDSAVKRIQKLRTMQDKKLLLRVTVSGGGCSGFKYTLDLTDEIGAGDLTFDDTIVTDEVSLPFLEGSVIKFDEGLIGSEFKIENPNAVSGCGCGNSFST